MRDVKSIPTGFHTVTPSIVVRNAAKAIEFYQEAFGAREVMRMPGPRGGISHAEIRIGDSVVMIADEMIELNTKGPRSYGGSPVSFYLYVNDVDAAWERALDAGAKMLAPLDNMFWGDRVGRIEDPFGHTWLLAQRVEDATPAEMTEGLAAFTAKMRDGR